MVRVARIFKIYNGSVLIIFCLIALIPFLYLFMSYKELNITNKTSCTYTEPIDVVYTWVNGSDPLFIANLNHYLNKNENIDASKQRYEDKNELRFSLRSLEKFAPWINHVYLVTNGQIPYWLNLDYEKLTVITHSMIFRDQSNLPTFSSPAIESNLHRIPGLSKRFIYFNDDIFLGQPLYLEDFFSESKGYLVFLAYTLPNCASDCPWLYVGDGQCDLTCNNERCQFDGGDCRENQSGKIVYADDINSEEPTESYNSALNNELHSLKKSVHDILSRHDQSIEIKNGNHTNRSKTEIHIESKRVSVSRLVKEHNKRVMRKNKLSQRKKRDLLKVKRNTLRNIDGFLESLEHTQKTFNKKYGFKQRYVPAHAPIFIDKDIMQGLENTFVTEFELTERNRFRHNDDMQFGFSYYYHLMSETVEKPIEAIFDKFDTDNSGTWSDREIRNILTKMYELPLSFDIVDHFEGILLNCSEFIEFPPIVAPLYERYIDSRLPTISKYMVTNCPYLSKFLKKKFGSVPKYKYDIVKDAEKTSTTFKMLVSNVTNVVLNLDEIRSHMRKFICLNDNLDEAKPDDNDLIKAILYDFYLALLPHTSKFELPEYSRNRFLYMNELREWRSRHFIVKIVLLLAIASLIVITFFNFFKKWCCALFSELFIYCY
ncbi:N-acetylglucosamine-1-phosphotransferase subunits alpha/beta [Euwallacea fornicatus]|uniref:N-acetylglucosamine-1-phosphotransferase subunits alpha/beta n=1 Tax=Euwallacea fornicatus TaxID=995702 RepID=UPI00338E21CE